MWGPASLLLPKLIIIDYNINHDIMNLKSKKYKELYTYIAVFSPTICPNTTTPIRLFSNIYDPLNQP